MEEDYDIYADDGLTEEVTREDQEVYDEYDEVDYGEGDDMNSAEILEVQAQLLPLTVEISEKSSNGDEPPPSKTFSAPEPSMSTSSALPILSKSLPAKPQISSNLARTPHHPLPARIPPRPSSATTDSAIQNIVRSTPSIRPLASTSSITTKSNLPANPLLALRREADLNSSSGTSTSRNTNPAKMTSAFIGELHWWTSDRDLSEQLEAIGVPKCDCQSITFQEHKVNGKSKGVAYVDLNTQENAAKVKQWFEHNDFQNKRMTVQLSYGSAGYNPFRTLPKEPAFREKSVSGGHNPADNNSGFIHRGASPASVGSNSGSGAGIAQRSYRAGQAPLHKPSIPNGPVTSAMVYGGGGGGGGGGNRLTHNNIMSGQSNLGGGRLASSQPSSGSSLPFLPVGSYGTGSMMSQTPQLYPGSGNFVPQPQGNGSIGLHHQPQTMMMNMPTPPFTGMHMGNMGMGHHPASQWPGMMNMMPPSMMGGGMMVGGGAGVGASGGGGMGSVGYPVYNPPGSIGGGGVGFVEDPGSRKRSRLDG